MLKLYFSLLIIFSSLLRAQAPYSAPIEGKLILTGNYAEIRPNHFHAGIDFKTDPVKHVQVKSVSRGYISRIKIGIHGYGRALYITHPDGHTTVYGHLHHFSKVLQDYTEERQRDCQSYEIELFPDPNLFKIEKGEVVGYSGNTGDSGGPHLHFEVRETKSEVPLNPLRFLVIPDSIRPSLRSIILYGSGYFRELTKPPLKKDYFWSDSVQVFGEVGIGIVGYDQEIKAGNLNNFRTAEIYIDNKLYYKHILDSIPFSLSRYVNAYCGVGGKVVSGQKIQKCFLTKNNQLPIYKLIHERGYIHFDDTLFHIIKVVIVDFNGNKDSFRFFMKEKQEVKGRKKIGKGHYPLKGEWVEADCDTEIRKSGDFFELTIPPLSFYDDAVILCGGGDGQVIFTGMDYNMFLQIPAILKLKGSLLNFSHKEKLCLERLDSDGKREYQEGEFKEGWVEGKIRQFGTYRLAVDTVPPKIKVRGKLNLSGDLELGDDILFSISDSFSGIGNFRLYANGGFVLSEYDAKTGTLRAAIDRYFPLGKLQLLLMAEDKKGNVSFWEKDIFIREQLENKKSH